MFIRKKDHDIKNYPPQWTLKLLPSKNIVQNFENANPPHTLFLNAR